MRKFFVQVFFCIFWTLENGTRLVMTLIIKMFRELYLMTLKCPVGDVKAIQIAYTKTSVWNSANKSRYINIKAGKQV